MRPSMATRGARAAWAEASSPPRSAPLPPSSSGADYSGLMDEFRLAKTLVAKPSLSAYGTDPGLVISPVADLGAGHSRLRSIEVTRKTPAETSIEFSYRISDEWGGLGPRFPPSGYPSGPARASPTRPWAAMSRLRAELYPRREGQGEPRAFLLSPPLRARRASPPALPRRGDAQERGPIELRWSRVPESDMAGYLVYYGDAPGEYYGTEAVEGASPLDVGLTTTVTLTGIPNGKLIYIVIAAYDSARPSRRGCYPRGRILERGRGETLQDGTMKTQTAKKKTRSSSWSGPAARSSSGTSIPRSAFRAST